MVVLEGNSGARALLLPAVLGLDGLGAMAESWARDGAVSLSGVHNNMLD